MKMFLTKRYTCILVLVLLVFISCLYGFSKDEQINIEQHDKISFSLEELTDEVLTTDAYINQVESMTVNQDEKDVYYALPYAKGVLYTRYFHYSETSDWGWELCYVEETEHQIIDSGIATKKDLLPEPVLVGDTPVYVHEVNMNEQESSYVIKQLIRDNVELIAERKGETLIGESMESFDERYGFMIERNDEQLICIGNLREVERCIPLVSRDLFAFDLTDNYLWYAVDAKSPSLFAVNMSDGTKLNVAISTEIDEICGGKDGFAVGRSGNQLYYFDVLDNHIIVDEVTVLTESFENCDFVSEELKDHCIIMKTETGNYKLIINAEE